jgi:hypothetical protein
MNIERLTNAFKENQPRTPMSEEETMIMLNIMMSKEPEFSTDVNELDNTSEVYKHFKPLIGGFQMQIFLKRLEHLAGLRISLGAFLLISQHLNSAGDAVMYAYYMSRKLSKNSLVGFDEVTKALFPWGYFSEEQLKKIWDAQKVRPEDGLDECKCYGAPDNLLDYVEIWERE